jgi:monoamine oxidase
MVYFCIKGWFFLARTPLASILQKSFALASVGMEKQISTGQAIILEGNTSQKALVTLEKEKK